ncbi:teleost multiple tissue opsin a [Sinocyclocheilus anshuiensis]|uniref:Parapinopsin-like n=1 Tax=Sinocyclocheilus anshuiensis TaxID=1608454 RepID=A0A671SA82_9TELE|nr:PREDICTED: parapinopsin-like [Sinocyclocheilus anshuiensis]
MIASNLSVISCRRANSALCLSAVEEHLEASSSYRNLSPTGHLLVAVTLGFIGTFGFLNNLLVLVLFCRYKILRSPINFLLVNICLSDLLVCVLGTPFSFAASTQGRWLIGDTGCVWYGFANSLLGIVSLISLAVLSYERYCTMMGSTEADATNYKKVAGGVVMSWVYSLIWTLPPLFGWSRYGPEGHGTTCSVDWTTKTANNISYIICLFIFCLIVPFLVIVFCYGKLLHAIKQVSGVNKPMSRKRAHRVLLMVIFYLLCWLPYGIMALLATFGAPGLVTAEASIVPSILAKSSTFINPIIYIFMNKQFYRCFRALFNCDKPQRGSSLKSSSKVTKPVRLGWRTDNFTFVVASLGPTVLPNQANPAEDGPLSTDNAKSAVVSLVAHYNG